MMKDEFISTISHEIRTPLTSIKGFTQTMLDNWDNLDTQQKKKFLNIINEQSQRLINLVENVLNVAKLEGDGKDFVLKEVDILCAVKKTLELFKGREFILKSFENVQNALCDEDLLQQILVNIIGNACKYSDREIEISYSIEGNFNLIKVKDYGCGIDENDLDKIFDKFYRAQNYLTSKAQGSGLGLYIAQKLAKKMGGKIEVRSEAKSEMKTDKTGSEFIIYLPIFEVEAHTKKVGF